MFKSYLIIFISITLFFTSPIFAKYDLDSANSFLAEILTNNDAKQIFAPINTGHYQGADLEQYLFSLFDTKGDENKINYLFNTRTPLVKSKELRIVFFDILDKMIKKQILDDEMIEKAKKIIIEKKADAKYFSFEKQKEVINFYNKKYDNDKWVRVNSKSWVYSAATAKLIYEDASNYLTTGEKLQNKQLIEKSKALFCTLEGFKDSKDRCVEAERINKKLNAKNEAEDSIIVAQSDLKQGETKENIDKKNVQSISLKKGSPRKGKYLFKKNCYKCHNKNGESKELIPANKTTIQWEEAFKPEKIDTYMCKYIIGKLNNNELNDIYAYFHKLASDSQKTVKERDTTRKVKTATAKDKINKDTGADTRKMENAKLFKGKIIWFFADLWEKLHTGSFFGSSRICGENMMNYRNTGVAKCYNKLVFK